MKKKGNWKTYQFIQIADNIVERVMPSSGDEKKYIGLEHMDTGTLHITRWGSETELIGEKLRIQKGDVLFARRRAYLKRASIAPFDGIFSAHGMVLRPNCDVVAKEFFPFFILSDIFLDRAIQISVGSLSPTVNWGTLKKEVFILPPIDEQKRITELLWAADEVIESQKLLYLSMEDYYLSYICETLFSNSSRKVPFEKIAKFNNGTLQYSKLSPEYEFKYIDIGSIIRPKCLGEVKTMALKEAPSRARRLVKEGDILISTVRPNLQSFVRIESPCEYVASTGFAVATPRSKTWGTIIYHSLFSKQFYNYCENNVRGTNYPAISIDAIKRFNINISEKEDVENIAQKLDQMQKAMDNIANNIDSAKSLQKQLISKYLGGTN